MTLRRFSAFALIVTAVIHLAVVPEHVKEWPLAAAFFVVLAGAEVALAAVVLRTQSRRMLLLGAAVSAASAALWVASRTTGLPFGPDPFSPEAVGRADVAATALEVLGVVAFLRLARISRPLVATLVAAVFVTGACSAPASKAATRNVSIDTFMFSPNTLHVHTGDRVVWTNHDAILHTVTSRTFNLQLDGKGATGAHTFMKRGTEHYFCSRHPGMEADVEVS